VARRDATWKARGRGGWVSRRKDARRRAAHATAAGEMTVSPVSEAGLRAREPWMPAVATSSVGRDRRRPSTPSTAPFHRAATFSLATRNPACRRASGPGDPDPRRSRPPPAGPALPPRAVGESGGRRRSGSADRADPLCRGRATAAACAPRFAHVAAPGVRGRDWVLTGVGAAARLGIAPFAPNAVAGAGVPRDLRRHVPRGNGLILPSSRVVVPAGCGGVETLTATDPCWAGCVLGCLSN
jgi:hypothetical protein